MARFEGKASQAVLAFCMGGLIGQAANAAEFPAVDLELYSDLRLTTVAGEPTWFKDWLGKLRYGGDWQGGRQTKLRLSELSLIAKSDITWDLHAFVHAKFDPEQDKPADLVEAYLRYRPVPTSRWQYQLKAGLFFPHISREHTSVAWTSPYTITPSAINSWIGEEIRTLGLEAKATLKLDQQKLSFTGGAFGFNDPAGTLLAFRGWALGDYKVGAFSRLPLPPISSIGPDSDFLRFQPLWVNPVREVDNKVGYYGAVDWSHKVGFKAGAFFYDNRGDPEVIKHSQYGWDTKFWNFYTEVEAPMGIDLMAQYLTGNTKMGFFKYGGDFRAVDVDYASGFVMASRKFGKHRLSVRRDWFDTDDNSFVVEDNNNEVGTAWTVAFNAHLGKKDSIIAEMLHVNSTRPFRESVWFDAQQSQTLWQLSYRRRF